MKSRKSEMRAMPLVVIGSLVFSGCASNNVKKEEFEALKNQVSTLEHQQAYMLNHIELSQGYDRNSLIMAFKLHDHLVQLKEKLCGVRFVVRFAVRMANL